MAFSVVSRVAGLGALTAAGQLLIIGSLPAYSKIFDPGMYGEYVIFVGAYTVISVLAGVRYDSAIVLPRSDARAATLSALVMLIAIAVSVSIAAAVLLAWTFDWAPARWLPLERDFGYGLAASTAIGALQRCLILTTEIPLARPLGHLHAPSRGEAEPRRIGPRSDRPRRASAVQRASNDR